MNTEAKPSIKLLFSSSDDGTVKIWDLIVSIVSFVCTTVVLGDIDSGRTSIP